MCNYVVSKLSPIIGSTRLDIIELHRLAHVVLLNLIKQLVSSTVIIVIIRVDMLMLAKSSQVYRRLAMRQSYGLSITCR